MTECNYTPTDLIVCGNVYCTLNITSRYISSAVHIKEYYNSMAMYEFRNRIKYSKIIGNLYIYNGCIKITSNILSHCDTDKLINTDDFIHNGDLFIHGDFLGVNLYASNNINSYYDIPLKVFRKCKIKEIFNE